MTRILIVDDHPVLAEGLKLLMTKAKISDSIDMAEDIKKALKLLAKNRYVLVLLDIGLPDGSGIDLCKTIHERYPDIKILVISSFSEFTYARKMLDNGAMGYILKNSMPDEILEGITDVLNNKKYICHEIDTILKKERNKHIFLTPRETELLRLIAEGHTNIEIAEKLFLGQETINSYRKNLLFKLNARNTAVMVKMAIEQKLI